MIWFRIDPKISRFLGYSFWGFFLIINLYYIFFTPLDTWTILNTIGAAASINGLQDLYFNK
jgi:hypothetical protein